MSSGWFDIYKPLEYRESYTEPCPTASPQEEQCVEGNCTEIPGGLTYIASSALKWFEKVRGSSLQLNHLELVYMYPPPLVPTMK